MLDLTKKIFFANVCIKYMNKKWKYFFIIISFFGAFPCNAGDIRNSKHNLASWSNNTYRSTNYSEICVFCHTPHQSIGRWPLWNRVYDYDNIYKTYSSPSGKYTFAVDEHTKLCYSCHYETNFSTVQLNRPSVYKNRQQPIMNASRLPSRELFQSEGAKDHPVSVNYVTSQQSGKHHLRPKAIVESKLGLDVFKNDIFTCTSCHSSSGVHGGGAGSMLRIPNRSSALCDGCHDVSP